MSDEAIAVEDLYYTYPDGTPALRGATFAVPRGARAALVGPNGAGKSTLILHLNGILRGQGRVKILGETLTTENLRAVRRKVGLVFQNPDDQLFALRVLDDVAYGPLNQDLPPEEAERRAREALEAVGMAHAADKAPHHLSFGERRRVCIAGLLAMQPEILVLDEPTANLDPRGRRELINMLKTLGVTLLVASHDLEFVLDLCDLGFLMDEGRIIAGGPPRELLSNAQLLSAHGLEQPLSLRLRRSPEPPG